MNERVLTMRRARACIAAGPAGPGCGDDGIRRESGGGGSGQVYCGFGSAAAATWLQQVNAETSSCDVVVFTVITRAYDQLPPLFLGNTTKTASNISLKLGALCYVALVDGPTLKAEQSRKSSGAHWTLIRLPEPLPFADSMPRLAHTLKMSASRIFQAARYVIYHDGKLRLALTPDVLVANLAQRSRAPLLAMAHSRRGAQIDGVRLEFKATEERLRKATRNATELKRDLAQLHAQYHLYEAEGAFNHHWGLIDSAILVHQRVGSPAGINASAVARVAATAAQRVLDEAATPITVAAAPAAVLAGDDTELEAGARERRNALRWIECAWFTEVAILSHREQLSFARVVDELGARRHVFLFEAGETWFRGNTGPHGLGVARIGKPRRAANVIDSKHATLHTAAPAPADAARSFDSGS